MYLWKPAYPCRYRKQDSAQAQQPSPQEVAEVAAEYEARFQRRERSPDEPRSRATTLYKYNPRTKSLYRSDIEPTETHERIRLEDVEETQKQLNEEAQRIKNHIDCLSVKLQVVNRGIDYNKPRRIYRDNLSLGIRPTKLFYY